MYLVNACCFWQVMRKKSTNIAGMVLASSAHKAIAKASRPQSSLATVVTSHKRAPLVDDVHDTDTSIPLDDLSTMVHGGSTMDEAAGTNGSRERSTSPLESNLLRYLTAHITPPTEEVSDLCVEVTSFVIGRSEYLQGIVRLVQSDCPEVAHDMEHFMAAMKDAFTEVNNCNGKVFY